MVSAKLTDIGQVRTENQDAVFVSDIPVGILPNLYIVADGMGGHRAGEIASASAIEAFVRNASDTGMKDVFSVLEESVKSANASIIEQATENPHMKEWGRLW
jgi:protein phosphatase